MPQGLVADPHKVQLYCGLVGVEEPLHGILDINFVSYCFETVQMFQHHFQRPLPLAPPEVAHRQTLPKPHSVVLLHEAIQLRLASASTVVFYRFLKMLEEARFVV